MSHLATSKIKYIVDHLSAGNFMSSTQELNQILTLYGGDAVLFLLKCLVGQIDFRDTKPQKDQQLRLQLLVNQIEQLPNKPNFVTLVSRAFEDVQSLHADFLNRFTRALRLNLGLEIMIGISLVRSHQASSHTEGLKFLKSKLTDLVTPGKEERLPEPILNELLLLVFTGSLFDAKARDAILKALNRAYAGQQPPRLLALLTEDPTALESRRDLFVQSELNDTGAYLKQVLTSLGPAKLVEDLGYECMTDVEKFTSILRSFGRVDEAGIAGIVGMMATSQSLDESITLALHGTPSKDSPKVSSWNTTVFLETVKSMFPSLNWHTVMRKLDYPDFKLTDQKGAIFIANLYKAATGEPFPVDTLLQKWTNVGGQLSFLRYAIALPDYFSFQSTKCIPPLEGAFPPGLSAKMRDMIQTWHSYALVETILILSTENGYYADALSLFDFPRTNCPGVLLLSLAQANVENELRLELLATLCSMFILTHHPNSSIVIQRLWHTNKYIVVDNMIRLYSRDTAHLSRILDVAQELQELKTILSIVPYHVFTMDLAALAARREYLNLDKWLADMIKEHTDMFARSIIRYIKGRLFDHAGEHTIGPSIETMHLFIRSMQANVLLLSPIAQEELKEILPALLPTPPVTVPTGVPGILNPQQQINPYAIPGAPQAVLSQYGTVPPGLIKQPAPPNSAVLINPTGVPQPQTTAATSPQVQQETFTEDIIADANQIFQELYEGRITIDQMLAKLKELRASRNQRDYRVFMCIIHTLFDEYRYFSKYPDKELQITATLFGALIQHRLISSLALGYALRYVLDSLKKPPNTKMFKFGLFALEEFISRLPEWPQYIAHIVQIPHLHQVRPDWMAQLQQFIPHAYDTPHDNKELVEYAHDHGSTVVPQPTTHNPPLYHPHQQQVPSIPHTSGQQLFQMATPGTAPQPEEPTVHTGAVLPISTLLKAPKQFEMPDDETTDRIKFILNNLSIQNLEEKAADLKKVLREKYYDFFANYLVSKRVSTEPNFHHLYLSLLETLNEQQLFSKVIEHTLHAVRALLASPKIRTTISERSLLKHLGMWLGNITLGRNKPLFHKDLPVKELLLQAYEYGILVAVVPFVSKILHSCAHSKIFKPPNPWVVALLRVLLEIYNLPDIKSHIQYEIELLFRHLEVDMDAHQPTTLLVNRRPYSGPDLVDFNNPPRPPEPSAPAHDVRDAAMAGQLPGEPKPAAPLTTWLSYIHISPKLEVFARFPDLRRIVYLAINRAIEEIIEPVVDRVVTIASTTTQKLTLKDFAMEPDENKLLHAAHCMVQSLASSLANVICKDPLRVSAINHLRNAVKELGPTIVGLGNVEMNLLDYSLQTAISENLDLACSVIEKVSTERAIGEVNEQLAPAVEARKAHREQQRISGQSQPYYDINLFSGRYPSALPDILRPQLGGIQPHQLAVYEEFLTRVPHAQATAISPTGLAPKVDPHAGMARPTPAVDPTRAHAEPPEPTDPMEGFSAALNELEQAAKQEGQVSLGMLAPDHYIHDLLKKAVAWVGRAPNRVEFAQAALQKLMKLIHGACTRSDSEPNLLRDVYVHALAGVVSSVPKLRRDVVSTLISWEEDKKFSKPLIYSLLRQKSLKVMDFDVHLANQLDKGRNKAVLEFAMWLLKKCLLEDKLILPSEVFNTVDELDKVVQRGTSPLGEGLSALLTQVRHAAAEEEKLKASGQTKNFGLAPIPRAMMQKIASLFNDWVTLFSQSQGQMSDSAQMQYVQQLQQLGLYGSKDANENELAFYRGATECAIISYFQAIRADHEDETQSEQRNEPYKAIDALAKLIVVLVKFYPEKVTLLGRIYSQVAQVMTGDFQSNPPEFNQKPYFRLFVDLLVHLNSPDPAFDANNLAFLFQFAEVLHYFQPKKYPGFTFAWVELMSHRTFMPKLLRDQRGWPVMQQLLVDLLEFLEPFLRKAKLTPEIRFLYKGTLRVLLVLLHDFPEFLCDYHFSFCDVLPPTCVQMRNLILSAFPRTMKLPDPLMPNLKVDLIPEIATQPRILSNFVQALIDARIKNELDLLLKNLRDLQQFIPELAERLMLNPQEATLRGTRYNVQLINSLVLYSGATAIKLETTGEGTGRPALELFRFLSANMDNEFRYYFFNAIANQLRYPNSHTHYFSKLLLILFHEAPDETIQEQITRVLLERLIAHRPHPWGLLITFIELIKNPTYNFWSRDFTRCTPEIERLFVSVARSCFPQAGN